MALSNFKTLLGAIPVFAALCAAPNEADAACTLKSIGKSYVRPGLSSSFDARKFIDIINDRMKDTVGFASLMQDKHGRRVLFTRRGWAVSPCDSAEEAQPFTLDTVANWGSVSKIITTATVLNTVRRSPNAKLSSKLSEMLPSRWRAGMHSRFNDVDVSMLLQHRGGFRRSGSGPWHPSNMRNRLQSGDAGPNRPAVGDRKYSNTSMGVFHYSTAFLWSPAWTHATEKKFKKLPNKTYDESIAAEAATVYNNSTRRFVFDPAGVSYATCNPVTAKIEGKPFALAYGSRSDRTGSRVSSKTRHCAAGGWAMSAKDMMRVIRGIAHGDDIIDPAQYRLMENRAKPNEAMGYWKVNGLEGGLGFGHNGKIHAGNGAFVGYVVNFPNGYQFVLVTNTDIPSGRLKAAAVEAYNAAKS
ncbi:MAG: serine hydrolase domain-containing protein [Myxococcota bacterium]